MIKYANKYPHPGARPTEEAEPATFSSDAIYRAWTARAARMQEWQVRMKQHLIACGLDDIFSRYLEAPQQAQAAAWLSLLQEPLPLEVFP